MGRHKIRKCRHCKAVVRRCRCLGPHDIEWTVCKKPDCAVAEAKASDGNGYDPDTLCDH